MAAAVKGGRRVPQAAAAPLRATQGPLLPQPPLPPHIVQPSPTTGWGREGRERALPNRHRTCSR